VNSSEDAFARFALDHFYYW